MHNYVKGMFSKIVENPSGRPVRTDDDPSVKPLTAVENTLPTDNRDIYNKKDLKNLILGKHPTIRRIRLTEDNCFPSIEIELAHQIPHEQCLQSIAESISHISVRTKQ